MDNFTKLSGVLKFSDVALGHFFEYNGQKYVKTQLFLYNAIYSFYNNAWNITNSDSPGRFSGEEFVKTIWSKNNTHCCLDNLGLEE